MPDKTDAALVQEALARDDQAFCELVQRYKDAVFATALARVTDFHEAEEVAQEAFVRAYMNLAQLREPAKFGGWLRTVTANVCSNWLRHKVRRRLPTADLADDDIADTGVSPDRQAELNEARDIVLRAIHSLPEGEREATTLYYVDGYTQSDIARFLDVPHGTIRRRLHQARQRLEGEVVDLIDVTLKQEAPSMEFTEKVLDDALERVKEAERRRDTGSMIERCEETLHIIEHMPDSTEHQSTRSRVMRTHAVAASQWLERPDHDAIAEMREALQIAKEVGDDAEAAASNHHLGLLLIRSGQLDRGFRHFERAIEAAESGGRHDLGGNAYYDLAGTSIRLGERARALEAVQRYTRFAHRSGDPGLIAESQAATDLVCEVAESWWRPSQRHSRGFAHSWLQVELSKRDVQLHERIGVCYDYSNLDEPYAPLLGWPAFFIAFRTAARAFRITNRRRRGWTEEMHSAPEPTIKFRGTSTIRSVTDVVRTPAGRFVDCVRIDTRIKVADRQPSEALRDDTRGRRSIWLAPGVGLVRVRFRFENGAQTRIELLDDSIADDSSSLMPLAEGNLWRYEQRSGGIVTRDLCRVVRCIGGGAGAKTAYLSCSNWSVAQDQR